MASGFVFVAYLLLLQIISLKLGGPYFPIVFTITFVCFGLSLLVGVLFARYVILHVFNRQLPKSIISLLRVYWQILLITKPLEILWRFSTAWMRCLPDLYVVGEVRCGTTTVSSMLVKELRVTGPFTPFIHPTLDGKESFYLVGHYLGFVHPFFYRMCFPTYIEKWIYEFLNGRKMLIYDGCAQYLNSPWVCNMIKEITPNATIVACIREPMSQNKSWWKFEQMSQNWADSMGLPKPAPSFRCQYPPKNLDEAFRLSQSEQIRGMFKKALSLTGPFLPSWAVPTPNGQLSGFTQMTGYATNIRRYVDAFGANRVVVSPVSRLSANPASLLSEIGKALKTDITSSIPGKTIETKILNPSTQGDRKLLEMSEDSKETVSKLHRMQNKALFNILCEINHPRGEIPAWVR